MSHSHIFTAGALLALASSPFAQESWAFNDGNGFSAVATFRLVNPTTLEVSLLNTSMGIPAVADSSDTILTGLSWDFDGESSILGGTAATGLTSMSVGFTTEVGANDDISGEWGFGNIGSTNMYPQMISANEAHMMPFGGANLVGPVALNGPGGGVISNEGAALLGGQGAVKDEVVVTLALTDPLADLAFLLNGVRFEWGSDYVFGEGQPVCDVPASLTTIPDANGYNANGALTSSAVPVLGTTMSICFDDAADTCGIAPGSLAFFYYSTNPSSIPVGFGGCGGGPSEILIDAFNLYGQVGPLVWAGPGNPACFDVSIPGGDPKCGVTFYAQGGFISAGGPTVQVTLTNALELVLGAE